MASSMQRPGALLNIVQCTGQPPPTKKLFPAKCQQCLIWETNDLLDFWTEQGVLMAKSPRSPKLPGAATHVRIPPTLGQEQEHRPPAKVLLTWTLFCQDAYPGKQFMISTRHSLERKSSHTFVLWNLLRSDAAFHCSALETALAKHLDAVMLYTFFCTVSFSLSSHSVCHIT